MGRGERMKREDKRKSERERGQERQDSSRELK